MTSTLLIPDSATRVAARALIRGQVQGVGFRPYIYRLATDCHLTGRVGNVSAGVLIEIEGFANDLVRFRDEVLRHPPAGARIDALAWEPIDPSGYESFAIERSAEGGPLLARVPRDRATCAACRDEVFSTSNRRHGYPFTNCTACGPRYSILCAMPYERPVTSMRQFVLCAACDREYRTADDRRFHAEPNACGECGPRVSLFDAAGQAIAEPNQAIAAAAELLGRGRIIAIKGLGGFQLLARADDVEVIARLRQRKQRPRKPFAVMVGDLDTAEAQAHLDAPERLLLIAPENPIALVQRRGAGLAENIAPGLDTIGLFLPTTPLHHLLLERFGRPVVATSGNRNDEPIVIDEREAINSLAGIADAFLIHNRPIVRRLDDSIARVIDGEPVVIRLGRGFAPLALPAIEEVARKNGVPPIVATGAHLKNALAVWTGSQAILGAHIGDLESPAMRQSFVDSERDFGHLYRFEPSTIACDQHPDYFTTHWAHERNLPVIEVQHHHAHAVACMVEHHLLEREVLALTWDGTGFGPDGTIWGGEVLRVQGSRFERVASLLPFALPGGEAAIRHPNRIAFALLWQLMGEQSLRKEGWLRRLGLEMNEARILGTMIYRRTNCPMTSSVGRLFDAVAALVLSVRESTYEGEAAATLEAIADEAIDECYPLPWFNSISDVPRCDWRPMVEAILHDLDGEVPAGRIAARFHNALAAWAESAVYRESTTDVVLSGGCFQNRFLVERVGARLRRAGRRVYSHHSIPPGDGGLAAGQLAVAVMRIAEQRSRSSSAS